eukprot:CAMPEP_0201129070 /NCGR_PEP_ID=MMETSP0850-20130426/35734_1 /ASSEMBLY_ACC=CAM_ASM_000622 /TAXON_ID=183588 /ORGANISM="Pseudo-nitzschia fraudulenta, Strain WWA7" /LENGTH=449 /DNA_ID=CAMNT_0047398445 /DNA_START=216 /DNA_END=1565 /DNA_ORIENTATION=+
MAKDSSSSRRNDLFKVRTITAFITLENSDFDGAAETLKSKLRDTAGALHAVREQLEAGDGGGNGYEVQTVRIATNPFPEYLLGSNSDSGGVVEERLKLLDDCLEEHGIVFVSLGPASCPETLKVCTKIVGLPSGRFSCSVQLPANDAGLARASAETVLDNSKLGNPEDGGLANFRFCVANLGPYVPFFPAAKAASKTDEAFCIRFAIGLENGALVKDLLARDAGKTLAKVLPPKNQDGESSGGGSSFAAGMAEVVRPLQSICERVVAGKNQEQGFSSPQLEYLGLDASFNPSLDEEGSVASAVEVLNEVPKGFGGAGTIAATAAMTTAIQTRLSSSGEEFGIKLTGYNGLMLPLCEDRRLAQLATEGKIDISDLLNVSSVCGVGIDTVPVPGDADAEELTALLLDVAGLAERWNKPLSCRVFPVPNRKVGDMTTFDSPFLVNSKILPLS